MTTEIVYNSFKEALPDVVDQVFKGKKSQTYTFIKGADRTGKVEVLLKSKDSFSFGSCQEGSKEMESVALEVKEFFGSVMLDPYFNLQTDSPDLYRTLKHAVRQFSSGSESKELQIFENNSLKLCFTDVYQFPYYKRKEIGTLEKEVQQFFIDCPIQRFYP